MIKKLSANLVYVSGTYLGAIYDFTTKKVYSVNHEGKLIIEKYISNLLLNSYDQTFLDTISSMFGLKQFQIMDFKFQTEQPKTLEFAWLEVTQRCTSRCIHCYEGDCHMEAEEPLSFEKWKEIITDLIRLGCKRIQFIGGEPSLYDRLPDLIYYTSKFDIRMSVFSNLFTLSEKLYNAIINNNVDVHFSIYGATADVHDAITQTKCSFENLLDSIRKLSKCDVNLIAHVVCMRENETDILSIYKLLSKLGIKTVKYDEIRNVFGMSQSEHAVSKSKLNIKKPNFSCSLEDFNNSASHNTCWCGKCVISTNGDVFPCEFERNIKYGNVLYDSLADILMTPLVQECWNLSLNKIPICKECEFRFACKDCRPLAYGVCGNIFEKNPRCKYNPFKGIWK